MENTPNVILGEANLKAWVNSVDPNNMLNRQVRMRRQQIVVCIGYLWIRRFGVLAFFNFGGERTRAIRMMIQ